MLAKPVITRFVLAALVAVLSSWVLVPGMTEADTLTVDTQGRVYIDGEVITSYVSRRVLAAAPYATPRHAAIAAQLVQSALDEAVQEWRTQPRGRSWSTILAQAMNRKRRAVADAMVRLANELDQLTGPEDGMAQKFMAKNADLAAHAQMHDVILTTAGIVVRSLTDRMAGLLTLQGTAATPAVQPPVGSVQSQTKRGLPCPGARLVPNPATNGINWVCPK